MGKTFIKVGLFIFALIFIINSRASFAMTADLNINNDQSRFNIINIASVNKASDTTKADAKPKQNDAEKKPIKKAKKTPKPQKYTVVSGDSLTKIAKVYKTSWQRLFDKNIKISDPDSINPGDVIVIPKSTEKLAKRTVATVTKELATATLNNSQVTPATTPTDYTTSRGSSTGNTYTPGYCTWYAKNRRPDLPNSLGNASSWVASAAAQGIPTGTTPRVGAIGQQGNHVVYVEKVNNNGTVSISEMNYGGGLFVVHSRTVSASNFIYIY